MEKLPVSPKEACAILHCCRSTLDSWIKQGTIQGKKIGGRMQVWLPAEIVRKSPNN